MFQRCRYGEHFQAHGGHSSEVRERNESSQTLVRRFAQISLAFLPLVHFSFGMGMSSEYIYRAGK